MSKFKVGDKARVVYTRNRFDANSLWREGAVVTIDSFLKINPLGKRRCDCRVLIRDGKSAYPKFDQLEPITEQSSSWEEIEAEFNWNPSKQGVTG